MVLIKSCPIPFPLFTSRIFITRPSINPSYNTIHDTQIFQEFSKLPPEMTNSPSKVPGILQLSIHLEPRIPSQKRCNQSSSIALRLLATQCTRDNPLSLTYPTQPCSPEPLASVTGSAESAGVRISSVVVLFGGHNRRMCRLLVTYSATLPLFHDLPAPVGK